VGRDGGLVSKCAAQVLNKHEACFRTSAELVTDRLGADG